MKIFSLLLIIQSFAISTCNVSGICTKEYRPTTCSAQNLIITGSNPCVARTKLLKSLCTSGVTEINSFEISCQGAQSSSFISTCKAPQFCTREYKPSQCVFEDQKEKGSNTCEARRKLLKNLCKQGVKKVAAQKIKCASSEIPRPMPIACQNRPSFCTMEYNPSTCRYKTFSSFGTNPCKARKNLMNELCAQSMPVKASQIRCSSNTFMQ